jgi:hypothetical protein
LRSKTGGIAGSGGFEVPKVETLRDGPSERLMECRSPKQLFGQ